MSETTDNLYLATTAVYITCIICLVTYKKVKKSIMFASCTTVLLSNVFPTLYTILFLKGTEENNRKSV